MVERVAKLEKELEERSLVKGEDRHDQPLYESSSDAGIESGTEADDCLSVKWVRLTDSDRIEDLIERNSVSKKENKNLINNIWLDVRQT